MPDLFLEQSDDCVSYAVKGFGTDHHLKSDEVAQFGIVRERPKTGPLLVCNRRVLVGLLPFTVTGCSPDKNRVDPCTCNGQGYIAANPDSLCRSNDLPVLRVGDEGLCVGVGSLSGIPTPVVCRVSIGRSCQTRTVAAPDHPTAGVKLGASIAVDNVEKTARHEFHLVLEWSDGSPVAGALFHATGDGEEISGRLDDEGEAIFSLRSVKCSVQFPEYDTSLLLRVEGAN